MRGRFTITELTDRGVTVKVELNEHLTWHRSNFPEHPRVALDRWIHGHAMVSAPEPAMCEEWGGAKFDQALAIARAEQAAEKAARKAGVR